MTLTLGRDRPTIVPDKQDNETIVEFVKNLMQRRNRVPTQMAADLGVSHPTVFRWLSGEDVPSTTSCRRLAEYSGIPAEKILAMAGHLPQITPTAPVEWPEFREYIRLKYPNELDNDLIDIVGELIERRKGSNPKEI